MGEAAWVAIGIGIVTLILLIASSYESKE